MKRTSRWTVAEEVSSAEISRIIANSPVQEIKRNRQRTVYRVEGDTNEWYVKSCRVDGIRAWFRELFRGPKAKLEFDRARELNRRGVSAVQPIAWSGHRWPSTSQIITQSVPCAIPLSEFLERDFPQLEPIRQRRIRIVLARALGQFFATMYRSGVAHPDPHPGNLLVSFDETDEPKLTLIDVHAVSISKRLPVRAIVENLVLFNRWFAMRSTRTDRLRFWKSFVKNCGFQTDTLAQEVERKTVRSNLHFWKRRFDRYRGTNREYQPIRVGAYRGQVVREYPIEIFEPLLRNPDSFLNSDCVDVLKSSKSSRVVSCSVDTPNGPKPVVFKRVPIRSWFAVVKNLFRPSSVWRSWSNGQSVRDRGIPTPRPLVVFHRYRFGIPLEGFILIEKVPFPSISQDRLID